MYTPKAKTKSIKRLIDLRKSPEYVAGLKQIVNQQFESIKKDFLNSFDNHPVTREIEGGISASNVSRTLGGYGNLFTYIGFDNNDKPIDNIRNQFSKIFITNIVVKKDGSSIVFVSYPSPQDIFNVTPLPWAEGRSWAEGIEKGLSGFGMYLNKEHINSRSGSGIQTPNTIRKGKFQNRSYITKLIREFEKKIIKLNRLTF